MGNLFNVAVLDTMTPNALDTEIEAESLKVLGSVKRFQIQDEKELPDAFFKDTDAVIIWHQIKLHDFSIKRFEKCRIIVRNGVGFDNVDIKAAGEKGIAVCNVPDYGTEEVADHTLALTLMMLRNIIPYVDQTKNNGWDWKIGEGKIRRFSEMTFGIIGLGRIGTAAALRAKAFGFKVIFYDPYLTPGVEKSLGLHRAENISDLIKVSDVISLHCPLSEETRNMLGQKEFENMKDGTFIVNTARSGIIEIEALKINLKTNKIRAAALDVAPSEPPADKELSLIENLYLTPHAAFYSKEAFIECRKSSAVVVRKFFENGKLLNLVNKEYLK